ncbi:MAG TPA: biotin-independent malonate decarboxylase subunit beta [Bacillus bacterium]|uniref:biotin-independent malonate decarboxylase subunit beta n=1 Tax=Siminovitchia fordii TaxID=254759 RepID=UPI000361705A|nr:biotin-independent malonate decarboxylase subunit beta [Siminovitchia fordii]HBZ08408.1 biotin-independent malonate decarboxylase subunit beta [Bacillus sp. (in: firmicutes)]
MIKTIKASFVECDARERILGLLDEGTFRELLGPMDEFESPHLEPQGIVPQSDDGVVVAKGRIYNQPSIVISIESKFQGGGIGEVSGAKIAGALELALEECKRGAHIIPVLVFDTGGVRLQEANYGLLSIAEISAAIVALKHYVPVIGVVPGKVGAFGGMSITAGLCSAIIMTREGRLGLNGPEVIEQEAGIREFDSRNRPLIWGTIGGEQRTASGFADILVEDDIREMKDAVSSVMTGQAVDTARTDQIGQYESLLHSIDPTKPLSPEMVRSLWQQKNNTPPNKIGSPENGGKTSGRGQVWFDLLRGNAPEIGDLPSVQVADGVIGDKKVRFIAVVPDSQNKFPRARKGEFGLLEGWSVAKHVQEAIKEDQNGEKRAIIAIVDVPSQAYGYREELLGIHQACAAAVSAYASARLNGHPVVAFIPGKAISGAFLSHGMQANRLIALRDPGVNVHVMSKESAARITQRTLEELEAATKEVPAMAYDINSFEKLGALFSLVDHVEADHPGEEDRNTIYKEIEKAIEDVEKDQSKDLSTRLKTHLAASGRAASILVREKLREQWS